MFYRLVYTGQCLIVVDSVHYTLYTVYAIQQCTLYSYTIREGPSELVQWPVYLQCTLH